MSQCQGRLRWSPLRPAAVWRDSLASPAREEDGEGGAHPGAKFEILSLPSTLTVSQHPILQEKMSFELDLALPVLKEPVDQMREGLKAGGFRSEAVAPHPVQAFQAKVRAIREFAIILPGCGKCKIAWFDRSHGVKGRSGLTSFSFEISAMCVLLQLLPMLRLLHVRVRKGDSSKCAQK